jgi:hypothetical protein
MLSINNEILGDRSISSYHCFSLCLIHNLAEVINGIYLKSKVKYKEIYSITRSCYHTILVVVFIFLTIKR